MPLNRQKKIVSLQYFKIKTSQKKIILIELSSGRWIGCKIFVIKKLYNSITILVILVLSFLILKQINLEKCTKLTII